MLSVSFSIFNHWYLSLPDGVDLPVGVVPGSAVDVSIFVAPVAPSSLACRARFSSIETRKASANSGSSLGSTPNSKPPPPLGITAPAPSSPCEHISWQYTFILIFPQTDLIELTRKN